MENIQVLIDFLDGIPGEQWIGGTFEREVDGITKRCVAGHINYHLSGNAFPPKGWEYDSNVEPAVPLLKKLGIERYELVVVNNNAHHERRDVKTAVITHLKSKVA